MKKYRFILLFFCLGAVSAHTYQVRDDCYEDDLESALGDYSLILSRQRIMPVNLLASYMFPNTVFLSDEDSEQLESFVSVHGTNNNHDINGFAQYYAFYKKQHAQSLMECPGMREAMLLAAYLNCTSSENQLVLFYLTENDELYVFLLTSSTSMPADTEKEAIDYAIENGARVIFYDQQEKQFQNTLRKKTQQQTETEIDAKANTIDAAETVAFQYLQRVTAALFFILIGVVIGMNFSY